MLWSAIFAVGLLVGVAAAIYRRCPLLLRSAAVLSANALACNLAQVATGLNNPVLAFACIDIVSAVIMLWQPAGRTQAILGRIYIVQLGLHYGHWAGGMHDVGGYWQMLAVGGALQIAFLIMGAINGDGRKVHSGRGAGGNHNMAVAHVTARDAEGR